MLKADILILNGRIVLLSILQNEGFDAKMGARPLSRLINEKVKLPLQNCYWKIQTTTK